MRRLIPVLKVTTYILVIVLTCNTGLARISNNGAGSAYDGGDGDDSARTAYNSVEVYIVEAAGFYLNANAEVQKLLRIIELQDLQGLDYTELAEITDNAVINMIYAMESYENLIGKAETTPYNETVIALLNKFDYNTFMLDYDLNSTIFTTAAEYLQKGDITGVFKHTYNTYLKILEILLPMRDSISNGKLPELAAFWQLNETFSSASIFGSCVARVFAAIQQP